MAIVTITTDYGLDVRSDGFKETIPSGEDFLGKSGGGTWRCAYRFLLVGNIPDGATVTKVQLIANVVSATSVGSDSWYEGLYLGTDPETDIGSVMYAGCEVSGAPYVTTTDYRTTGLKTTDLGATAVTNVQTAFGLGAKFKVALRIVDEGRAPSYGAGLDEIASANPVKLEVTYTLASSVSGPLISRSKRQLQQLLAG